MMLKKDIEEQKEGEDDLETGENDHKQCKTKANSDIVWWRPDHKTIIALQSERILQDDRIVVGQESRDVWTLTIRDTTGEDAGVYMCQVNTNPVKYMEAMVTILVSPKLVTTQSTQSEIVTLEGREVVIECEATGNPQPNITWRRSDHKVMNLPMPCSNNQDDEDKTYTDKLNEQGTDHLAARSHDDRLDEDGKSVTSELEVIEVTPRDFGFYSCFVSNEHGEAEAKVELYVAPVIVHTSEKVGAAVTWNATIRCYVEAYPLPTGYWHKDGVALEQGSKYQYVMKPSGIRGPGVVTALLRADGAILSSLRADLAWLRADTKTLLALNDHVIHDDSRVSSSGDGTLTIAETRPADSGFYMCQINTSPVRHVTMQLIVLVPPKLLRSEKLPDTDVQVIEGANVTLYCEATGVPTPGITWRRQDKSAMSLSPPAATSSGNLLTLYNVSSADWGIYLCIAQNGVPPSVSRSIEVRVEFKPKIIETTWRVGASRGRNATLSCTVKGFPDPVGYWHKNRVMLNSGSKYDTLVQSPDTVTTSIALIIQRVGALDYGFYTCVTSNQHGTTDARVELYDSGAVLGQGKSAAGSSDDKRQSKSNPSLNAKSSEAEWTDVGGAVRTGRPQIRNDEPQGQAPAATASVSSALPARQPTSALLCWLVVAALSARALHT
ncbi:PREDICTED: hemicentin-1-like [Priapulus caudatus]|uniref:Hemicentin-1-like n=1 Tax=Priapulus caudatus TaxID=37621 RepID=A0ABM1DRY2_PRICU|nr:PREDICTED: hemicentin-1-like [Priapulus caudatus]